MMATRQTVPLIDLKHQYRALQHDVDAAVARVLSSGWYILGQEVEAFEHEFAAYLAQLHSTSEPVQPDIETALQCVGVNSGTDALEIALRACQIGPGNEVITVAHTAVATATAISLTGATPIFVDVDPDTYTMDPQALAAAITPRTRAVIPVHLYGHPAEMQSILSIAQAAGLYVIEDCAQAHGARYGQARVGTIGDLGCFSFYPTKNLGAFGDGGAVVGSNRELMDRVRLLREYGWTPAARYISQIKGRNSRLDEMQAAILRVKLAALDEWNQARRALAAAYSRCLPADCQLPVEAASCEHVYHLYVVRVRNRDQLCAHLRSQDIATAVHYPVPVHLQPAYRDHTASLPATEQLVREIVSLPMHPFLQDSDIERIAATIQSALTDSVAPDRLA